MKRKLKECVSACQIFLGEMEMENGRHNLFNFQLPKSDTKIMNEKLKDFFNKLTSAAKVDIALIFVLRNVQTGEYRYYFAHENNPLVEKLHLLRTI